MTYAHLNELRYRATRPRNQLVLFNGTTPKTPTKKATLRQVLWPYCRKYCDIASVHGVRYLTDPKRQYFERIIWMLLLVATTCGCLYVYDDLADLYSSKRIQTIVLDSMTPIFIKPFPAIGICPRNRINWPKLMESHQKFLSPNASAEAIHTFRQFFSILSDFSFGKFSVLRWLNKLNLDLSLLDDVEITEVMRHVSFTCDELFVQPCRWRRVAYNCCDLFSMERTNNGFCYVFNSVITKENQERERNDRFYPYHNSKTKELSGLDVIVKLDKSKQSPFLRGTDGIYVMVKQPQQLHGDPRFVFHNTYTKLPVVPQFTYTDERTRAVTPEQRRCLFQDEIDHPLYKKIPGLEYRRANCFARCHQEYVFKYCKCNLRLFFPQVESDNITACTAKDFKCLYEYREFFKSDSHISEREYIENVSNNTMTCNCLNSCNQLIFVTNYISWPLEDYNITEDLQYVHLDAHYTSLYMMRYSTQIRYSFVELLANFGGIIGLFLGGSLMSVVELFYYFTIGLYIYLREKGFISNICISSHRTTTKVAHFNHRQLSRRRKRFLENSKPTPEIHFRR